VKSCFVAGTSLQASRLGFGTASLHRLFGETDRQALLAGAMNAGFTHFDTARMYGEGTAERAVGRFLKGGLRREVTLASKFGLPAVAVFERFPALMYAHRAFGGLARKIGLNGGRQRVRTLAPAAAESSLTKSLTALQTDWLDILFVHEPQLGDVTDLHALAEWFIKQKSSGRVRYLGLAGSAANCLAVMQNVPGVFDVLQVADSLAAREADILKTAGQPIQVTYGYLRRALGQPMNSSASQIDGLSVMRAALARNRNGMVLLSSLKANRLQDMAALTDQEALS